MAPSPPDYAAISRQTLDAINRLRQTPQHFIPLVEKDLANFVGDDRIETAPNSFLMCNAGKKEWTEALSVLQDMVKQKKKSASS